MPGDTGKERKVEVKNHLGIYIDKPKEKHMLVY
jgi:hypothetical protein